MADGCRRFANKRQQKRRRLTRQLSCVCLSATTAVGGSATGPAGPACHSGGATTFALQSGQAPDWLRVQRALHWLHWRQTMSQRTGSSTRFRAPPTHERPVGTSKAPLGVCRAREACPNARQWWPERSSCLVGQPASQLASWTTFELRSASTTSETERESESENKNENENETRTGAARIGGDEQNWLAATMRLTLSAAAAAAALRVRPCCPAPIWRRRQSRGRLIVSVISTSFAGRAHKGNGRPASRLLGGRKRRPTK